MRAPGWPVEVAEGRVGIRPLRTRDASAWVELRQRNAQWLAPWEATPPGSGFGGTPTRALFVTMLRTLRRQARVGEALPLAVTYDGSLAGQVTVGSIVRGSLNSGYVGYWVDEALAGRGVMPAALALTVDHCLGPVGMHRVEANVRPENVASRRVVEKLGFREEGLRLRYLHIDGAYRDHICYAVTTGDVPGGLLQRWRTVRDLR